jgi:dihydropteroate synthase
MPEGVYLHPMGLIYGAAARQAVDAGLALVLAGRSDIAFTLLAVIEGRGEASPSLHPAAQLAASGETALAEILGRLTAPRHDVGGLSLSRTRLMGIVNVTPDSFSDGGLFADREAAIAQAKRLIADKADYVDIGGESTRPGAAPVPLSQECDRALPVVEALVKVGAVVSIDTRKAEVMRAAADAGARIINDVTALAFDPASAATAAATGLDVVLMHIQGAPETMQDKPAYDDVVLDVYDALAERIAFAEAAGIPRHRIVADPGIGFGKTFLHNLEILERLSLFHGLGVPLLVGASRKGFVGAVTGVGDALARQAGSATAAIAAAQQGAQILRVHDVAETRQALDMWEHTVGITRANLGRRDAS